jgi:hypothetical protein
MDNSVHATQPVALARMRGAHRFEVFSLKLKRRLTFDRRSAVDEWIVLESDPTVRVFCERPGYVQFGGHRFLADFQVCYADRQELLLLHDPVAVDNGKPHAELDANAVTVRLLEPAELARVAIRQGSIRCQLSIQIREAGPLTRPACNSANTAARATTGSPVENSRSMASND